MFRSIFLIFLLFGVVLHARSLEEIKDSGFIKIAMRTNAMTYTLEKGKIVPGFDYALALEFSKFLGLKLELVHVDMFRDFWLKDDELIFKMKPPVTPDIFKKSDMTLDITSVNEKRKKYINMVPYIENKSILFSNKDLGIKSVENLIGKRVLLFEGMQSEYLLKKILEKKNIPYKISFCNFDEKQNKVVHDAKFDLIDDKVNLVIMSSKARMPFLYIYLSVYKKEVDVTSADAFSLFQKLHMYEYLKEDLSPSFTLEKKTGYLSATMPKHSEKLEIEFSKFVKQSEKNGLLDMLMMKHLNVDLQNYRKILEYHED